MKILLSLLLLPFVLIIGFLKGIFGGAAGAKNLKYIPNIVERLATDPSLQGSAFEEIKFPQVLAYAEEMGTVTQKESSFFAFLIKINSTVYSVKVNRTQDGSNCAVFHSEKNAPMTPIRKVRKEEVHTSNIIDQLEIAYVKHEHKCRW